MRITFSGKKLAGYKVLGILISVSFLAISNSAIMAESSNSILFNENINSEIVKDVKNTKTAKLKIPGDIEITQGERKSILSYIQKYPNVFAEDNYIITAHREQENWNQYVLFPYEKGSREVNYYGDSIDLITKVVDEKNIETYILGKDNALLSRSSIPESFISIENNTLLRTLLHEEHKLPWTGGQTWSKTGTWHGSYGNNNGIDFSPTVINNWQKDTAVLSSKSGKLKLLCDDGYQDVFKIEHNDGVSYYLHLDKGSARLDLVEQNIERGQFLGNTFQTHVTTPNGACTGTFDYNTRCGCGSANHLHYGFPSTNMTIDGYTAQEIGKPGTRNYTSTNDGSYVPPTPRVGILQNNGYMQAIEGPLSLNWVLERTDTIDFQLEGDRIAILRDTNGGDLFIKEGPLNAGWSWMNWDVKKFQLEGDRIGILRGNGDMMVREGPLGLDWTLEMGGVTDFQLEGNRIAVLTSTNNGSLYIKEGGLGASWNFMAYDVNNFELNGDRVGFTNHAKEFYVKEGPLNAGWTLEQLNVEDFQLEGDRIAILQATHQGDLFVKEGPLNAGWVWLTHEAEFFELDGDRVGYVNANNELRVKEGPLNAGWVLEWTETKDFQLEGNRIGVHRNNDGNGFFVKEGDLYAGWTWMNWQIEKFQLLGSY